VDVEVDGGLLLYETSTSADGPAGRSGDSCPANCQGQVAKESVMTLAWNSNAPDLTDINIRSANLQFQWLYGHMRMLAT